jgi:hypothetical protein
VKTTVALAAMAVAALAGCGTGDDDVPTVSRLVLQADIADRLGGTGETPQSVTCQEDLVGLVGRIVRCDVVITESNRFQPIVSVVRVDGTTVDYEMTPALSQEQLESAVAGLVARNSGDRVDAVACVSGLDGRVDASALCDVDAGGKRARRTVRVTEVAGLTMNFTLTSG